jgi:hypothetical protein
VLRVLAIRGGLVRALSRTGCLFLS